MTKMEKAVNGVFAAIGTSLSFLFGEFDVAIQVLLLFMVLDYITGLIVAVKNKELSSEVGFTGLAKKLLILVILMVAVALDRLIGNDGWVFRTVVCYFYIANEGISLLENAGNMGLPIPTKIKDILIQLRDKEGETE